MQEAYIRGFEKLHQFRKEARFSTWLGRILINCALQHLNQLKKKNQVSIEALGNADLENLQEETSIPDDNQEVSKNLKQALESAISHLPSKYRVVFILREIEEVSVADTASMLEITEDNVKIRLHRAKNMLKDMLRAEASSLDIFAFHASRCAYRCEGNGPYKFPDDLSIWKYSQGAIVPLNAVELVRRPAAPILLFPT